MNKRILTFMLILGAVISLCLPWTCAQPETKPKEPVLTVVSFYKADLVAVLQQLAAECGYNVIITQAVKGEVTLKFQNVTFEEVLNFIIQSQGLSYHREGKNFYIGIPGQLPQDQRITGYFHLYYADPKQVGEYLKILLKNGDVIADERSRTIIITAPQKVMEEAGMIINTLDQKMQQVTIEVKVVEVSISALRRLGVEWQIDDNSLNWGTTSSGAELILQMIHAGHSWNAIFKLLTKEGNARLVTAPSISTVEGKEASILIGDKIPIEIKDKDGNITIEYLEVGVKLLFIPWVQQNQEISIDLKTQVNSLGEKNGTYYTIGARELNSKIQANIGETVFLGGLITQEERETLMKIPLLGSIPVLGKFFQQNEKLKGETELIITITPRWNNPVKLFDEKK